MIVSCALAERSYDIVVERGILQQLESVLDTKRKYFVITDDGVPQEIIDSVVKQCPNNHVLRIPQGESSKCFAWYEKCIQELLDLQVQRQDCILAVGGGVVGDLTGFVAASVLRGIDFVNIPTTTLSQIDSSIGGKVGLDVGYHKNCVGAFWQPKKVIIDPTVLETLPKRHLYNGLVEALKAGLIGDKKLFELFEQADFLHHLDEIIIRSLQVKRYIVEQDEKEVGLRKLLNFGHTIGHAIESATQFQMYYHGECVGLGMLAVLPQGAIKERTKKILVKMNCPTSIECKSDELCHYIKQDKKAHGQWITMVEVNEIGKAELVEKTSDEVERLCKTL